MSTTVALPFSPVSPADVAVGFLDQSKLLLRKTTPTPDGLGTVSEYVYADGNAQRPTSVIVRTSINAKTGVVNTSVLLRSTLVETIDLVDQPGQTIEFSLNWNTPGVSYDTSVVRTMMLAAFSLGFNGVTSKVPNMGVIDALNRGITEVFG